MLQVFRTRAGWIAAAACELCLGGCASPAGVDRAARASRITFSVLDIETTGLDARRDRIVEIGVLKLRGGVTGKKRSWLINPGIPVPESARRVHGITSEMVRDCPAFAEILPEFEEFTRGTVVLAHNARYETAFFRAECERAGVPLEPRLVVDTVPLCRKWFPDALRHSLEHLAEYLDIETARQHRALDDAATLRSVVNRLLRTRPAGMTLGELIQAAGGEYRLGGALDRGADQSSESSGRL